MDNQTGQATSTPATKPKHPWLSLGLIMLLGLGLRLAGVLWGQSYCYFGQGDGIAAYLVAVDYSQGEPAAQYIGQPNYNAYSKLPGPLWTWFCYAGWRLTGTIEGVIWQLVLLNTAVIGLVYLLAMRTAGPRVGLFAALFAATLPWAIYYSICIYNPDIMFFLGTLLFLALWQVASRERARSIFWVLLLLPALFQFHMSGLMLVPVVLLVLVLCPMRINRPWLVAGLLAGLATYLPYVLGEMANGWSNTRGMLSGESSGYSIEALKAVTAPLTFLTNFSLRWTRSWDEYFAVGRACFGSSAVFLALNVISFILTGFLVVGAVSLLRAAFRGVWRAPRAAFAKVPGIFFLGLVFIVPTILAVTGGKSFHTRYCLVFLGPQLVLAGLVTVRWLAHPRYRSIFLALLVVTTCTNLWFVPNMFWHQGKQIESGPLFIPSFRKLEFVYQSLKTHAGQDRLVRVDDIDYIQSLSAKDKWLREASLISRYVAVRERERALPAGGAAAVYRLCAAGQVQSGSSVVFQSNGIALVAVP